MSSLGLGKVWNGVKGIPGQQLIYASHVVALITGSGAKAHDADKNTTGDLNDWQDQDLDTLIEEGRRQLDRQHDDLERVRGRAQVLFTVGVALVGVVGGLRSTVSGAHQMWLNALWFASLAVLGWSVLGAAATAVVRADLSTIHAAVLSRYASPVKKKLAGDYASIMMKNENQLATRLINMRISVTVLLIGGTMALGSWIWAATDHATPRRAATSHRCLRAVRPHGGPMLHGDARDCHR
jgi:hypothetical protein